MPMTREGLSSPPYYRPSPQQFPYHHQQNPVGPSQPPEFVMPMSMFPPAIVPTTPGLNMSGRSGHPHHHHAGPSGNLPGAGGLYSLGDMQSPSSFHMSMMVDSSTPTNVSMRNVIPPQFLRGVVGGGEMTGIKDLNNYMPVHKIRLEEDATRLFTVENNVTRETIVVLACTSKIILYIMKIKNDDETKIPSEKFEFIKFHELSILPHDLEGFVISQNCSITLAPFKLTYALSTRGGKSVLVYDQGDSNQVPDCLKIEDIKDDNPDSLLSQLDHDYPVTHLAIDAEKDSLACIQELGTIVVWDIHTRTKIAVFHIPNQGVYLSFHRSEPHQLLVIDVNGWVRYFNVFSQRCFRSIHLVQNGVFSAEWSSACSDTVGAGFAESFAVINTCKMLTHMNKYYDVPEQVINAIKINPYDDKVFATLSRLSGTIQMWRDNFGTHIWKHRNSHVKDIAWVHGFPYLLALGHQGIFVYDTSIS